MTFAVGSSNRAAASTRGLEQRAGAPRMLVGAMLGNMVSANTLLTFTFGIFISTFHTAYGWSRADIAVSMTCLTAVVFLGSSLVGKAADTGNARTLSVASMLAFGIGLMLVPWLVHSVGSLWLAYLVLAILGLGTSPVVFNRPLMSAFSRRRGLALALALTGTGIGGFALPLLTAALVARGGWQLGFTGLGCLVVVLVPVVWLALGGASRLRSVTPALVPRSTEPGLPFRDVCRSSTFWTLSAIALLGGLGMSGPVVHLVPLFGDHGIGPQAAARWVAIIGVMSVIGRIVTGVALDRFDTPLPGMPAIGLGALGLWLLASFDLKTAAFAIAALGFVIGAEISLLAYYSSRYFGLRAHATIFGWTYGMIGFGSAIGPVVVGALRDRLGDYSLAFELSGAALAMASLLCLSLGRYRYPAKIENPPTASKKF
jgi:MFS family permease